jgi:hypothetical protein
LRQGNWAKARPRADFGKQGLTQMKAGWTLIHANADRSAARRGSGTSPASPFPFQFPLGLKPEFYVAPLGTAPLYPDFMSAFTYEVAFLQLGRRHFGLIREFVEGLSRPVVTYQLPDPSIALGTLPKLARFLHLDTSPP